jgi:hypothetical protein
MAIVLVEWDAPMKADFEASRGQVLGPVLRPQLALYLS